MNLEALDSQEGKTMRCPSCRRELEVPFVSVVPLDGGPPVKLEDRALRPGDDSMPLPSGDEKEQKRRRKESEKRSGKRRRGPWIAFEEGWLGDLNGGIAAGALTMLVAVIWLVVGLCFGILFFYPIALFFLGLGSLLYGLNST
jgi:hypothetical protein